MPREDKDYGSEFCWSSSYTLPHLIDVRLDHNPVRALAEWCSKHDCYIGACAYRWFLKANPEVAKRIEEQRTKDNASLDA